MDLFSVVKLEAPQRVTIGVRPLRSGETPILQATAGRVVDLVIPEPEGSPAAVAAPPLQQVAPNAQPTPRVAQTPPVQDVVDLDESSEEEQEGPQLVRKRTSSGEHPSKKLRFDDEAGPSSAQLEQVIYFNLLPFCQAFIVC